MTNTFIGRGSRASAIAAAVLLAAALSGCTSASGEGSTVDTGTIGGAAVGGLTGALLSKNPLVIGGLAVAGGIAGNELIDKPRAEEKRKRAASQRQAEAARERQLQQAEAARERQRQLDYERQSQLQREEVRQQIEEQRLYEQWKRERVRQGQDGPVDVSGAQRLLKAHGLYQGPVDGVYGPATEQAVRRFEAKQGRPQTGTLTPGLMSEMRATL